MMINDHDVSAQEGETSRSRPALPTDFNAFLRIGQDGRVACYTGKIEMGQGVITSLAQMLADELDVALEAVDMVMGDTDLCPWDMGTFGSMSTRFFGPPLRAAAAEGRQVLLELAATQLNRPVDQLMTDNGAIFERANKSRRITYAELAKGQKIARHATSQVPLKTPDQFKVMGRPVFRRDGYVKVTGQAKYAADIQLPGMLYARILRPPAHDARRIAVDLSEAKQVEGVQVVEEDDLIAVLHPFPDIAEYALSKIKAEYDNPSSTLNVHIISPFVGGGFGGKSVNRQAVEAARLSQVSGKPVQVAWTRQEEFFYDSFRPAAVVQIRSGIDGNGLIQYWDYHVYFAGDRGAPHFYSIPHSSTTSHGSGWGGESGTHPFATGAWRAPGNNTNTFARESQIDIMAAAANRRSSPWARSLRMPYSMLWERGTSNYL